MFGRVASLAVRALSSAVAAQGHGLQASQAASAVCPVPAMLRRSFATNSVDIFNTHRDTPDNNADTKFEISAVSGCDASAALPRCTAYRHTT